MALTIRRGTTRAFLIGLDNCTKSDYLWKNFQGTKVRLRQGSVIIDRPVTMVDNDATACMVYFTEKDTLKLSSNIGAKLQISSYRETPAHSVVLKSKEFEVIVLPSLWDTSVTDGIFDDDSVISLSDPLYPAPIAHDIYQTLHINVDEYSGIIAENAQIIEYIDVTVDGTMDGVRLVYDENSETLSSQ